jgi:hypothetical protein
MDLPLIVSNFHGEEDMTGYEKKITYRMQLADMLVYKSWYILVMDLSLIVQTIAPLLRSSISRFERLAGNCSASSTEFLIAPLMSP